MNGLADGVGLGSESVGGGCPFLLARRRGPVREGVHDGGRDGDLFCNERGWTPMLLAGGTHETRLRGHRRPGSEHAESRGARLLESGRVLGGVAGRSDEAWRESAMNDLDFAVRKEQSAKSKSAPFLVGADCDLLAKVRGR